MAETTDLPRDLEDRIGELVEEALDAVERADAVCREFPRLSHALETVADVDSGEPGEMERLSTLYKTTGLDLVMEALMAMDWRIYEATGSEALPRHGEVSQVTLRKQWAEVQGRRRRGGGRGAGP
jgi:hypothetical protein